MNSRSKVVFCLHLGYCHYKRQDPGRFMGQSPSEKNVKGARTECRGCSS